MARKSADEVLQEIKGGGKRRSADEVLRELKGNQETDMGSIKEGMTNKLKKQALGVQQIASDASRWASGESGDAYSPYRQAIEARRRELENAGLKPWTKMGELMMGGLEMAAMPAPQFVTAGALPRMGYNAGIGGLIGAIDPVDPEQPYARPMNSAQGAAIGAIMPEAMSVIPRTGGGIMSMISPRRAVKGYINREYPGVELPDEVGGLWSNVPESGGMGPVPPPFYFADGVKPTVGMVTDNAALRQMETMHRLKPGTKMAFHDRDIDNLMAIEAGIQSRALSPEAEQAAMDALNERTSSIRELALKSANAPSLAESGINPPSLTQRLNRSIDRILTDPGTRANPSARLVAKGARRDALGIGHPEFPDGYPGGATAEDVYQARKNIADSLQKTGINIDAKSQAVKSARRESVGLMNAIDDDLNAASGDLWQQYLDAYKSGIAPIEEGKSFASILDMARNAPYVPGTKTHALTPFMLRKAASDLTTKEIGKTTRDILTPANRRFIDDAAQALTATESAQKGVRTTLGSPTAEWGGMLVNEIANHAIRGTPGAALAMDVISALSTSKGAKLLNEALLDPNQMNGLLRLYHQGQAPSWFGEASGRITGALPEPVRAYSQSVARRYGSKK